MATDWTIIIVYVLLITVVAAVGLVIWMRKSKSKIAIIQDLRNPRADPVKYYFTLDKKEGLIKLYTNVITPFKSGILPPLDLKPYIYADGKIYGVRGATGQAQDDSISLLRRPMVSMVECAEISKNLADAVQNTISFYEVCKDLYVGEEVTFTYTKNKESQELDGTISNITQEGLEILVSQNTEREVQVITDGVKELQKRKEVQYVKYLFNTAHDIKAAKIKMDGEASSEKREKIGLDKFFTPSWVAINFGVIPVDNATPILIEQKEFIAMFNSAINDKMDQRKSWLEKNAPLLFLVMAVVGLGVAYAIESYATQSYVSGILAHASAVQSSLATSLLNVSKSVGGT